MSVTVCTVTAADVETAQERAVRRVDELARAVSGVLEVLAAIYRDEDWRYLRDRCGEPYRDFVGFVRDKLGGSESNARRYRQGVETLVAPLLEITGAEVRIPVTPNDVAVLGLSGASRVIEAAPGRLEGVGSAEERTAALRELIDTVISERRRRDIAADVVVDVLPSDAVPESLPAAADEPAAGAAAAGLAIVAGQGAHVSPAGESAGSFEGRGVGEHPPDRHEPTDSTPTVDVRAAGLPAAAPAGVRGDTADVGELRAALEVVLRLDPALAADALGGSGDVSSAARDCATAAQRLARLSNLLRVL
ncbi:hypothetical protein AAHS21_14745 [Mycobacterium sp. 050272]|uniref:hypothetical protein n=1 Tax=Mycobacterium sp. 050272 TaxID=3142488 RepID=UPI003198ACB2